MFSCPMSAKFDQSMKLYGEENNVACERNPIVSEWVNLKYKGAGHYVQTMFQFFQNWPCFIGFISSLDKITRRCVNVALCNHTWSILFQLVGNNVLTTWFKFGSIPTSFGWVHVVPSELHWNSLCSTWMVSILLFLVKYCCTWARWYAK